MATREASLIAGQHDFRFRFVCLCVSPCPCVWEPHGASEINSKPSTSRCCLSIALFRASTSTLLHRRHHRHHQPIAISTFILIPIVIPIIIVIVVLLLVQSSQLEKCYRFLFHFKFAKTPTLSGLARLEATFGPLNDSLRPFSVSFLWL